MAVFVSKVFGSKKKRYIKADDIEQAYRKLEKHENFFRIKEEPLTISDVVYLEVTNMILIE